MDASAESWTEDWKEETVYSGITIIKTSEKVIMWQCDVSLAVLKSSLKVSRIFVASTKRPHEIKHSFFF